MRRKKPIGFNADYFQVVTPSGQSCGHTHRTIKSAAHCLEHLDGKFVLAIRNGSMFISAENRQRMPRTIKLDFGNQEYLTPKQVCAFLEWERQRRRDSGD